MATSLREICQSIWKTSGVLLTNLINESGLILTCLGLYSRASYSRDVRLAALGPNPAHRDPIRWPQLSDSTHPTFSVAGLFSMEDKTSSFDLGRACAQQSFANAARCPK